MNYGKFIVITGLDGSGTTSLAKSLAKKDPNGYFMQTPDDIFSDIRDIFSDNIRNFCPASHYHLYLSAVILASEQIKQKLKTHNVYCVRYLMDTVVSHRVLGLNLSLDYNLGYYNIRKPDFTIFIDIDEDIRQERISRRGKSKLDKVLDDGVIRGRFMEEFDKFKHDIIRVSNNHSLKYLVQSVEDLIQ